MCPNSLETPLYKGFFRGYVCQKGCPNPAPTVPLLQRTSHHELLAAKIVFLDANLGFDVGMRIVAYEFEVFEVEIEDALDIGVDLHCGQGARLAGEL